MVDAAAATLAVHGEALAAAGISPETLPRPRVPSPAARSASAALPDHSGPFAYDGTLDGLRGIPLSELASVGRQATPFTKAGIDNVYDLLMRIPLRYVDRSCVQPIAHLRLGEEGTTIAKVTSSGTDTVGKTRRRVAKVAVSDGTSTMTCTFFNAAWQAARFSPGDEVLIQGTLDCWTNPNTGATKLQMVNPLIDVTGDDTAAVLPIYPQSQAAGLTTWAIHRAARESVSRLGELADPLPDQLRAYRRLLTRQEALEWVHRPTGHGAERAGRERLAYDELLRMQLALGMRRHRARAGTGIEHTADGSLTRKLISELPYPLTAAQQRAVLEIRDDMARPGPMHRLLQGDVGSGKTTVAVLAMLTAVEAGHQAALMAPTEILAAQLHANVARFTDQLSRSDGTPIVTATLLGKTRATERRRVIQGLLEGTIDIVVGTHALLSDDVTIANLGLVVVDEQHRFGVEQRAGLRERGVGGATPDMLVMTATPIPRTAAMTIFGDLDVTILDELPPGRTPIRTEWLSAAPDLLDPTDAPWAVIRSEIAAGRQAYVVCPLVEESETKAAASAEATASDLARGALAGLSIGLVHGKQKALEREHMMRSFAAGDIDVLVATTVIEVGVDVPNATVIAILDPASFGISQLHQLRGRVGRGQHRSTCLLVGDTASADAQRRLDALCATTDGFKLSEIDLEIRGAGTILGARQSGMSDLHVASLASDMHILMAARDDAARLLSGDPQLIRRPGLRAEVEAALGPDDQEWLARS